MIAWIKSVIVENIEALATKSLGLETCRSLPETKTPTACSDTAASQGTLAVDFYHDTVCICNNPCLKQTTVLE